MDRNNKNKSDVNILNDGLAQLGLEAEMGKLLFFVEDKDTYATIPTIWFQLEQASFYQADAVFFKKGLKENEYIPQLYIYDQTALKLAEQDTLVKIHKKVWTGGEVPIVCVFTKTEIKILDTTKPVEENQNKALEPAYLVENLKEIAGADAVFNESFAQKLKSGAYWDNSKVDFYSTSSYSKLTKLLRKVIDTFTKESGLENGSGIVQKLIIQCILVKYLEERQDEAGNSVFPSSFFQKYDNAEDFSDVLKKSSVFDFFADLNTNHFNGGIFHWKNEDILLFKGKQNAFDYLSEVLKGYMEDTGQQVIPFEDNFSRLYAFNYIPVELISRLYEEFIIKENKKQRINIENADKPNKKNDGVAYTPSHLVKLLVNEVMPLNDGPKNLGDFKILDPACGSAIFLVVAFKRLVQWWRANNNYEKPHLKDLKDLLDSVYGVDLDPKAVQISIFSLCIALCDELSPKEIWDDLKFESLGGKTIFEKDFFTWKEEIPDNLKFDIIIGNPPFVRGGLNKKQRICYIRDHAIEIPKRQIALRFLAESIPLLKNDKNLCLLIKSSSLLYNSSSKDYRNSLFENYHIDQIFDFTPLARSKALWDNVDVDVSAIFLTNKYPDYDKNILHAIFRRTKVNKERINFEIDKYDLHFVLRNEVLNNAHIFKLNLLGGGRLKSLIGKMTQYVSIESRQNELNIIVQEGHGTLPNKEHNTPVMINKRLNSRFGIAHNHTLQILETISEEERKRISDKCIYHAPNILISQTVDLDNKKIVIAISQEDIIIKNRYVAIHSIHNELASLRNVFDNIIHNNDAYMAYFLATSAKLLVYKNTSILKEDISNLPLLDNSFELSNKEKNIIYDILEYNQDFLRHGEESFVLNPLLDVKKEISFYGNEFSRVINDLYADTTNSFKLTDIIKFEKEELIGALFSYDDRKDISPQMRIESELTQIDGLVNFDINESLTAMRIIQYYAPNKVLFVKPNQKRYWLASIAYRDADSVFADILNNQ